MRVVVDTNVLVSAILFGALPGRLLSAWREDRLELVTLPEIVEEYVRVSERLTQRYPDVDIQPILALIVQNSDVVPSPRLPEPICDDRDDDKFLACALAAGAKVIVSGDKQLRAVSGYEGVTVATPRQFFDAWL